MKTRPLACAFIEAGRVRLTRDGQESRLDKPSRTVRPGDWLTFAIGGHAATVRVEALGERRGPASEAQELYTRLDKALP
jgi:ribosome-associated heat shock protein Hsp15